MVKIFRIKVLQQPEPTCKRVLPVLLYYFLDTVDSDHVTCGTENRAVGGVVQHVPRHCALVSLLSTLIYVFQGL